MAIAKTLRDEVEDVIFEQLKRLEPEYVADAYAGELNRAINNMSTRARSVTRIAELITRNWANGVNSSQRKKFYKSIEKAIGVDLNGIIREEGLEDIIEAKINENVALIKSIPEEYFKKLSTIINETTIRGENAKSIISQIKELGHSTDKRAKLIARDQTQKLNAAITQKRQTALGIEEYEWQTSSDERVRESHKRKNGKIIRWDKPPADTGHPGQDINCRCVAIPIINIQE